MANFKNFGFSDTPIQYTPFIQNFEVPGETPPVYNYFLLLNTSIFGLLNGNNLTLLS